MKIVVLAGGYSPERDVSLSSGSLIANALMECGHEVYLLDSYLGMEEGETCTYRKKGQGCPYSYEIGEMEPDLEVLKKKSGNGKGLFGNHVLSCCRSADVVFVALHGGAGENGQIQAALDVMGIPYTGTGYAGCLLAMDKHLAKVLVRTAGILTPDWSTYRQAGEIPEKPPFLPCVVKPCGCGSSIGVMMVEEQSQWTAAWEAAAMYELAVMAEKKIEGREFSVGVLKGQALPVIEIIPRNGFYDYQNKYQLGRTEEVCPAAITAEQELAMGKAAVKAHELLQLGSYSRVDFLMDGKGYIYFLEANTLPGMTPFSLFPQEAAAAGITYERLCEIIAYQGKGDYYEDRT